MRERAHELIPGGAHTYAKGDDQYPSNAPAFIARGKGCHVWDLRGREYIEYGMGLRAVTLGHAFEPVIAAAAAQMQLGTNFSRPAPIEVECATALLGCVKAAEMVKFAKNGSDATTAAVKLARAATGRDMVAICRDQPFFSVDDWFIGSTPMHAGIPETIRSLTVGFRYNDISSLSHLFDSFEKKIACVILEPEKERPPLPGFLNRVRELCHHHGALLIFDEMLTGFRHDLGGCQTQFDIAPDLSIFGKAMANGFSVSALVGKREFMNLGGIRHAGKRVFLLSTTHGAETHALAAALATIGVYQTQDVIGTLDARGSQLKNGVESIVNGLGLTGTFGLLGKPCNLVFFTNDANARPSQPFRTLFMQEMIKRGVIAPSFVVSYSHTISDIDRTLEAVSAALTVYRRALESGVERFLIGPSVRPVFRSDS